MQRIAHGSTSPPQPEVSAEAAEEKVGGDLLTPTPQLPNVRCFGYLFPDLAEKGEALLPESPATLENLARLGLAMRDRGGTSSPNSDIPSAYTYFAQFVDHDIAFTKIEPKAARDLTDSCMLGDSLLSPWPMEVIRARVKNRRAAILELDCVYGGESPLPRDENDGCLMALGKVSKKGYRPPGKDDDNDVPRGPMSAHHGRDRVAMIADPRNDQTLLISQLHVAFLRAHNAIVRLKKCSFEEAQRLLRQHYHWLIIHDFLMGRVADAGVVNQVLNSTNPLYKPSDEKFFLPLEFTVAAFRFGHSMIRDVYYYNDNYSSSSLESLFTLTALSDNVVPTPGKGYPTLPEDRIIQWEGFLPDFVENRNKARRIGTTLSEPLRTVLDETERPVPCETRLAVQDLKRGYMMRMPTGQEVANRLGLKPMTAQEIKDAVADAEQIAVLSDAGFLDRTPLWFYILAEAAAGKKDRLGPVGSRLVAEVLIGLVRRSEDSILKESTPPWSPSLGAVEGRFDLSDLLRLAGVFKG